ncbi:prepilin-type N-terminal cleavage/methylation domain-containing protein [Neobacillus cucumis]|uniref:prepilin-type N-terminal cleavage/methylation domain-containing protein n=1 Tax=Neobacillus cucumis TaxID=1740721 RepID=UPI0025599404|nr:prepilin-type N-terminal cleavage/methylation domain-containing protein [Neobacillus cucumis]
MVPALKAKMREQKGFTLIELLAVIIILGIIAAIAIPAIGNVITKSENKAKVQDALLIIDAAHLYVAEKHPDAVTYLTIDGASSTTSLGTYLDRVKDEGFKVTVTPTSQADGSVKYSYEIENHDACKIVSKETTPAKTDKVSEKALSAYKQ